jgi:hypothetical protein
VDDITADISFWLLVIMTPIALFSVFGEMYVWFLRRAGKDPHEEELPAFLRAVKSFGLAPGLLAFKPTREETLRRLSRVLRDAGSELQSTVEAMERDVARRERDLRDLTARVEALGSREDSLQARIEVLSRTEPEAARAFAELLAPSERSSRRRDYALFLAGVLSSAITAIVLSVLDVGERSARSP